jgi:tetratricopeptide (TPR) repeat protein
MKAPNGLIYLALALITLGIYAPALQSEFIGVDDPLYVTDNQHVQAGLTEQSIEWAFTTGWATNWHPLTWLSHMLDVQLFGMKPAGHHLTNVLLHTANALLLFAVLLRFTKKRWPSAVVAALFAWHPLHVESVAWVAERKDVLSCLFWLLTMLAYLRYVEKPGTGRYLLTLLLFAVGLMAKPMLVTLPFVLLLLDYWPLGRFTEAALRTDGLQSGDAAAARADWKQLLTEKIPFFALSVISSLITILVQQEGGAVSSLGGMPLGQRVTNAVISYCRYLAKLVSPRHLSVIYPYQTYWPSWMTIGTLLFLGLVSLRVFQMRRSNPWLIVGWLWFLGTLVPVIGLIQVGSQSMADRYTYIPAIGVFVMVVWEIADLGRAWLGRNYFMGLAAGMALGGCLAVTWVQVRFWKNTETLLVHASKAAPGNLMAHIWLGQYLNDQGRPDDAVVEFNQALLIHPKFFVAEYGLGCASALHENWAEALDHFSKADAAYPGAADIECKVGLAKFKLGKTDEALAMYLSALQKFPRLAEGHLNLADLLASQGQSADAASHYSEALRLKPDYPEAHRGIGVLLAKQGKLDEAVSHFSEAIRLDPKSAEGHYDLGLAWMMQGKAGSAIPEYEEAIRLKPEWTNALNDLAWIKATYPDPAIRNGPEAVRLAERACAIDGGKEPRFLGTLDAAYAEAGRFTEAIATAQKARDLALSLGRKDVANAADKRLELYRSGQPYHLAQ